MAKFVIEVLSCVNNLKFGATAKEVHKTFGSDFRKYTEELSDSSKNFIFEVTKRMAEMTGKSIEEFTRYDNDNEFDSDPCDYYSFCKIDYDDNGRFDAIEIYSDQESELIVDGKDFSDFELKKLLTLADDFVSEENNTSYTSYTKQIGIWCPDGNDRVECVLFGKPGYYQS